MRNFSEQVASQLHRLAPDVTLVEELAQDLEQRYLALILEGYADADAWREANAQMEWPRLSRELGHAARQQGGLLPARGRERRDA